MHAHASPGSIRLHAAGCSSSSSRLLLDGPARLHHARRPRAPPLTQPASSSGTGASTSSSGGRGSALDVLISNTRPVDRLRYQAKLVFKSFDKDGDGLLQPEQVSQYLAYSDARFGARTPALEALYADMGLTANKPISFEQFVDTVRAQVQLVSGDSRLLNAALPGAELGKLLYSCCITTREMGAALAAFKLMDLDNDGFIPAADLARTESIERRYADMVLEDAEEAVGQRIGFAEYAATYARERPVFLTMAIMAANVAAFWVLFNAPIDFVWKALLGALLLLKPQLINNPLIKIWTIGRTLMGRSQAELDMRLRGSG